MYFTYIIAELTGWEAGLKKHIHSWNSRPADKYHRKDDYVSWGLHAVYANRHSFTANTILAKQLIPYTSAFFIASLSTCSTLLRSLGSSLICALSRRYDEKRMFIPWYITSHLLISLLVCSFRCLFAHFLLIFKFASKWARKYRYNWINIKISKCMARGANRQF